MNEIAARWVTVYPKIASGFSSEVNTAVAKGASQGGKALGVGMEQSVKQVAPRIGSTFKSVVAPILTLSAVGATASFVKKSVDAFNEYEDAADAASVTFGASMGKIEAQANSAARTLGMSKQQTLEAATTFGVFANGAGLAGDASADFSTEMVALAADLASFRGKSPEQAIEAVGAALRGESEPIRAFGVLLDDATLRAQAMKMGLIETTKEALTPQQRVLAAQKELLAQTTLAQGNFNDTAHLGANVQKTLAAESADLAVEIGAHLQPAIVDAQKAGIGFLRWVSDNQEAIVPLVKTVGTLTLAVVGVVSASKGIEALKSARATIVGLGDAFSQMSTKAKAATITAGAVGVALTIAAGVYGVFAQKAADAERAVEDYTQALEADNGALGQNVQLMVAKRLEDEGALQAAQQLGISASLVTQAVLDQGDAMQRVRDIMAGRSDDMGEQTAESVRLGEAARLLDGVLGDENHRLQESVDGYKRVASATGAATTSTTGNTIATQTNSDAIATNAQKVNELYQARLKMRGDKRALEEAIDGATESVKKNGRTLDVNTAKGRANQQALDNIAAAGLAVKESLEKQQAPADKINEAMGRSRTAFIKAATAMGMSEDKARDLANKLGLLKKKAQDVDGTRVKLVASVTMNKSADEIVYSVAGHGNVKFTAKALGGRIIGPGTGTSDDVLLAASNGEWVIKEKSASYYGPAVMDAINEGKIPRSVFVGRFAAGGPVMPTYKGHSLDWWEDYLLTDLEMTRLEIRIKDLKADLKAKETYNPPGKKKRAKRNKLRGLERKEAQLELRDAEEQLRLAKDAAKANASKSGTLAERIAKFEERSEAWEEAQDAAKEQAEAREKARQVAAEEQARSRQETFDSAAAIWQQAAASLGKSAGLGSLDPELVKRTNAVGDVWYAKRDLTAADLAARVTEQANQVQTFIDLLDQLRKAGASEALISDVMALGTVEGTKAARMYLGDRKSMAIAEAGYTQLARSRDRLNAIGNQVGAAAIEVTINEAATPEATKQAVLDGILMART